MAEQKTIPELQKELEEIEKLIERQKPISFRQSRRLLRTGLLENIIAKSLSGQSLGDAISSGISDQMKAMAMKFKETTHPLGMARALSGGNPVGPLIVGKILGSDIKDIEYFSGMRLRSRHEDEEDMNDSDSNPLFIQKQQTKVTNIKMNESVTNAMGQLYTLYKKTYDHEKRIQKLHKLFAEEEDKEKDRQHKEVMDALEQLQQKASNIKIPEVEKTEQSVVGVPSKISKKTTPSPRKRPLTKSRLKSFFRKNKTGLMVGAAALGSSITSSLLTRHYTASELNLVKSKEVYEYLTKVKGLDHNNAVGMLANIQAESNFNSAAIGDNGTSGGLFQHHAERFDALQKAVPDWKTNWKGQIDFALNEKDASGYKNQKFNTPQEAADFWVRKFERPKDIEGEAHKRMAYSQLFSNELMTGASSTVPAQASSGQQISSMSAENATLKNEMQKTVTPVVVNNNNTVVTKLPNKSYGVPIEKDKMEISYESPFMWIQRGYS